MSTQKTLPTILLALITAPLVVTKRFQNHPADGKEGGHQAKFLGLHGEEVRDAQELDEPVGNLDDDVGGAGPLTGSDLADLPIMIGLSRWSPRAGIRHLIMRAGTNHRSLNGLVRAGEVTLIILQNHRQNLRMKETIKYVTR